MWLKEQFGRHFQSRWQNSDICCHMKQSDLTAARAPSGSCKNYGKSCVRGEGIFNRNHPRVLSVIPGWFTLLTLMICQCFLWHCICKGTTQHSKWENVNQRVNVKVMKPAMMKHSSCQRTGWEGPAGEHSASAGRAGTCRSPVGSPRVPTAHSECQASGPGKEGDFKQHVTRDHRDSHIRHTDPPKHTQPQHILKIFSNWNFN